MIQKIKTTDRKSAPQRLLFHTEMKAETLSVITESRKAQDSHSYTHTLITSTIHNTYTCTRTLVDTFTHSYTLPYRADRFEGRRTQSCSAPHFKPLQCNNSTDSNNHQQQLDYISLWCSSCVCTPTLSRTFCRHPRCIPNVFLCIMDVWVSWMRVSWKCMHA